MSSRIPRSLPNQHRRSNRQINNIFGHKKPSDDRHGRRAKGRKVFSARIFPNVPVGMADR